MPNDLLLLFALVFAVATFVHGFTGFAFGIVSISFLALTTVDLELATAAITLQALVVAGCILFLTARRDPIHWRLIALLAVGSSIGMPCGYWLLETFKDQTAFRIVLGVVIVCFGLHGLLPRRPVKLRRIWGLPLGIMSGCIGGATVSGGPPIIYFLYSQTDDPRTMKATVQTIFILVTGLRIVVATVQGSVMDTQLLVATAMLAPLTIVLLLCGHALSKRVSGDSFRRITFGFLIAIGLAGAVRATVVLLRNGAGM